MRNSLALAVAMACLALPGHAGASMIALQGHAPVDVENVLFNVPGLLDSGLVVTGATSDSGVLFRFTEDSSPLETPSAGQARVAAAGGASFDWLNVMADDPFTRFLAFEANVQLSSPATIRVSASGTSTTTMDFAGGSGENRFAVTTDGDDSISWVLIQTLGGNAIADVRQVRVGIAGSGAGAGDPREAPIPNPEPGTLLLLSTGLFVAARHVRSRRASNS